MRSSGANIAPNSASPRSGSMASWCSSMWWPERYASYGTASCVVPRCRRCRDRSCPQPKGVSSPRSPWTTTARAVSSDAWCCVPTTPVHFMRIRPKSSSATSSTPRCTGHWRRNPTRSSASTTASATLAVACGSGARCSVARTWTRDTSRPGRTHRLPVGRTRRHNRKGRRRTSRRAPTIPRPELCFASSPRSVSGTGPPSRWASPVRCPRWAACGAVTVSRGHRGVT